MTFLKSFRRNNSNIYSVQKGKEEKKGTIIMNKGCWNRVCALLLAIFLLLFSAAGCGTVKAEKKDLMEGVSAQQVIASGGLTDEAIRSTVAFSLDLFRRAVALGKENALISPASVLLALGMVANGADKDTLTAFENVLGRYGLSLADINLACRELEEKLKAVGGSTVQSVANSIWYDKNFEANKDFLQADKDYYEAAAYVADLSDSKTVEEINQWVEKNTNGLITDMIDSIPAQAIMLLFNTIYLKAVWQEQFDANDDNDGPFTLSNGNTVIATYMRNALGEETYLHNDEANGILLPYDDGNLAYVAILPTEGTTVEDYVCLLDEDGLKGLLDSAEQTNVRLLLPKYTVYFDTVLNDLLCDMGLSLAFDPDHADFSKMGSADGNIFISKVIHKTCMKVNELGTEAAAATGVVMEATSMPADDFITLTFDRPFVYAVIELDTGIPVFMGIMNNPAA